jgi:hypothetical protein
MASVLSGFSGQKFRKCARFFTGLPVLNWLRIDVGQQGAQMLVVAGPIGCWKVLKINNVGLSLSWP